jgi:peptidyl-dipeptidase A
MPFVSKREVTLAQRGSELTVRAGAYKRQVLLPRVLARKFKLLKLTLFSLPDPKEREEYTKIAASLEADYGKGKYCPRAGKHAGKCLAIGDIEKIIAVSRDPEEMKDLWLGWRRIGPPMRQRYTRLIELQNTYARYQRELAGKEIELAIHAGTEAWLIPDTGAEQFLSAERTSGRSSGD